MGESHLVSRVIYTQLERVFLPAVPSVTTYGIAETCFLSFVDLIAVKICFSTAIQPYFAAVQHTLQFRNILHSFITAGYVIQTFAEEFYFNPLFCNFTLVFFQQRSNSLPGFLRA